MIEGMWNGFVMMAMPVMFCAVCWLGWRSADELGAALAIIPAYLLTKQMAKLIIWREDDEYV